MLAVSRAIRARSWPSRNVACSMCGKSTRAGRCAACVRPPTLVPCPRCGDLFWPWAPTKTGKQPSHARRFCGCKAAASNRARYQAVAPSARVCRWCGAAYLGKGTGRFCSDAHRRARSNQRKHLRRRGHRRAVDIIPIEEIYQRDRGRCGLRDRGRCGLCHRPVAPAFRMQRASREHPTLDHILPLSKGGRHERSNVQLAHQGCNSRKSNRKCNSQLRLSI